jgi:lysophospholipase L1-like esterase
MFRHTTGLLRNTWYRVDTASGSSTPTTVTEPDGVTTVRNVYGGSGSTVRNTTPEDQAVFTSAVQTLYLKPLDWVGNVDGAGTVVTSTGVDLTVPAAADPAAAFAKRRYSLTTTNIDVAHLPKWAAAVFVVRAGTRDARLLCVGDSTTVGWQGATQATSPPLAGYPATLARILNETYCAADNGLGIPPSSVSNTDNRWTVGTNWSQGTAYPEVGFGGKSCNYLIAAATGALTYADPRIVADKFDVYYVTHPSHGTLTITATGGTPVVVDASAGGAATIGIGRTTVTAAAALSSNTVSITGTAAKNNFVVGVEPYLSTAKKIRVGNAGAGGASAASWTAFLSASTVNAFNGPVAIQAYQPDLTIIDISLNDASNAVSTGTRAAQIATLVAAAQVTGDVILMSGNPNGNALTYQAAQAAYAASDLATVGTGVGFIDFLKVARNYSAFSSLGYTFDALHPNASGYALKADVVASALVAVQA